MGAFENQIRENETFDSLLELYREALHNNRTMSRAIAKLQSELRATAATVERADEAVRWDAARFGALRNVGRWGRVDGPYGVSHWLVFHSNGDGIHFDDCEIEYLPHLADYLLTGRLPTDEELEAGRVEAEALAADTAEAGDVGEAG